MLIAKMPDGIPEIYPAFQGEGATISEHCVFVRLAGCNLNCNYCDTAYTWLWKGRKDKHRYSKPVKQSDYVMKMTPEQVADKIKEVAGEHTKRVIFTGGEPMIQKADIVKVIKELNIEDKFCTWEIELETNGTIEMDKDLAYSLNVVNCSPKLASSGNTNKTRNRSKAIEKLLGHYSYELIFKFVIHHDNLEKDMSEIIAWQGDYKVENSMIYLMPEGITEERIKEASPIIWKYAYDNGYKFSPRLQVMLYDKKRAV